MFLLLFVVDFVVTVVVARCGWSCAFVMLLLLAVMSVLCSAPVVVALAARASFPSSVLSPRIEWNGRG